MDSILDIEDENTSQDFSLLIGHLTAFAKSHQATKKILIYTGKNNISVTKIRSIAHNLGKKLVESEDLHLQTEIPNYILQSEKKENTVCAISVDGGRCRLWQSKEGEKLHKSDWKEAKLGCIASYVVVRGEENQLEPDLVKKKYIGRVNEESKKFGWRVYREALLSGYECAEHKIFLADGAPYNWDIQQTHFSSATAILDWYHATEHLAAVGKELYADGSIEFKNWFDHAKAVLFEGDHFYLDEILLDCKKHVKGKDKKEIVRKARNYFFHNRERIRYRSYLEKGLPISSCLVESGMKITVNERLKGSEKHWREKNANYILGLKIAEYNDGQQKLYQIIKKAA